jgi:hypothetical protein
LGPFGELNLVIALLDSFNFHEVFLELGLIIFTCYF